MPPGTEKIDSRRPDSTKASRAIGSTPTPRNIIPSITEITIRLLGDCSPSAIATGSLLRRLERSLSPRIERVDFGISAPEGILRPKGDMIISASNSPVSVLLKGLAGTTSNWVSIMVETMVASWQVVWSWDAKRTNLSCMLSRSAGWSDASKAQRTRVALPASSAMRLAGSWEIHMTP